MSNLRLGRYGNYYGSFYNESEALTTSEMETNAEYIYKYFTAKGWSMNAIAGMLGNMQAESAINPGRWQGNNVGGGPAYGIVQWDPFSKYINWCSEQGYSDPSEMDNNLARIIWELENGGQWYSTPSYRMSFAEFSTSTLPAGTLGRAWILNYERPADQSEAAQAYRASLAENWYAFLDTGDFPDVPGPDEPDPGPSPSYKKKKGYNFILFNRQRRWRV